MATRGERGKPGPIGPRGERARRVRGVSRVRSQRLGHRSQTVHGSADPRRRPCFGPPLDLRALFEVFLDQRDGTASHRGQGRQGCRAPSRPRPAATGPAHPWPAAAARRGGAGSNETPCLADMSSMCRSRRCGAGYCASDKEKRRAALLSSWTGFGSSPLLWSLQKRPAVGLQARRPEETGGGRRPMTNVENSPRKTRRPRLYDWLHVGLLLWQARTGEGA